MRELQSTVQGQRAEWRGFLLTRGGTDPDRRIAPLLHYRQTTQCAGVSPTQTGNLRPDRPETHDALPIKPDNPMGQADTEDGGMKDGITGKNSPPNTAQDAKVAQLSQEARVKEGTGQHDFLREGHNLRQGGSDISSKVLIVGGSASWAHGWWKRTDPRPRRFAGVSQSWHEEPQRGSRSRDGLRKDCHAYVHAADL